MVHKKEYRFTILMDSLFKVSYYFHEVTLQIQYSFLPKSEVFLITYTEGF
jgi:hypothetical protein